MNRKFIATVVTLTLCATMLVGCGSSVDSSSAAYESTDAPAAPEDILASAAEIDEPTMGVAEANQQEAEDDVDFGRPPEDECVSWDDEISEEDVTIPEVGEVEGIIVLQGDYKSNAYAPSFVVSAINPQTGDYHIVSSFVFEHVARIQEDEFLIDPSYKFTCCSNYRNMFNDDFTLMAATKTFLNDESKHAGWVNQSGEFYDLIVALNEQAQSDFEESKHYEAIGFTTDNRFVYAEMTDWRHPLYYAVPLDDITPGASYEITGDDPYIMGLDSAVWKWAKGNSRTCWVNDDQFLAVGYSDQAMICVRVTISSQAVEQIVPTGSQSSWSPVLGPDGSSVAFMSAPLKGTENPSIYLTNLDGNVTPTKLETSYSPLCGRVGDGGSVMYAISPAYYYASILEWR